MKKLITAISVTLLTTLIFPVLIIHFVKGSAGMGLCFILFLAVDPLAALCLGIMAGTSLRRLWWIPLAFALAFSLLFSLTVGGMVWGLFAYSGIYFASASLAMLGTHFGIKLVNKRKKPLE